MKTLVVGASGATGRLLVQQLLMKNEKVSVIVRSKELFLSTLDDNFKTDGRLSVMEADLLTLSIEDLVAQVKGCRAVVSCLGHNLTLKGIYGHPRRLVTEFVHRVCTAICFSSVNQQPVKFILMNSTGNRNVAADEKLPKFDAIVINLIRALLPPHADNEEAADYLQNRLENRNNKIEWVVVRPDSLINEGSVSNYKVYTSPVCSALFGDGKTSRVNVAHFMSQLVLNVDCWEQWKNQMPVIYNTDI
ncbi:NAD(P)-dependent oxidoreductase [Thalassotalea agariperforans]